MAAIGERSAELEAMRKGDRSWHPCSVSLSASRPATLTVEFCSKNFSEEYIIAGKDEVESYLRCRSVPLEDGECSNVQEGDQVLAMNKDHSKRLFFDAVVVKVRRVKHSKRVYCRCTFEVKWLHSESGVEDMVLTSNMIMKLSKKSIDSHSVVEEFLNSINSTQSTSGAPFLEERTPETDIQGLPEFDLQGLLEKQIEEISRFVDSSRENCEEDIIIGCSKVPNGDATIAKTNRRTLRSSAKTQMKKEPDSDDNKRIEDTSFLTPLAARAALASLMHELPNSIKFPDYAGKEEVFPEYPTSLKVKASTLNTDHSFQDLGARRAGDVSDSKSTVLNRHNISRSLYQSEQKGTPHTKKSTARLTRSMAQKGSSDTKNGTEEEFLGMGKKANTRLTRSMIEKRSQDLGEEIHEKCHVSPVKRETRNTQVIQKEEEDQFPDSQVAHVNSEIESKLDVTSTSNGSNITKKGTKRTRLANASENNKVNKEMIAVDDKQALTPKLSEPSKKPGSRFSPRLRLLQSNGSGK